jgi:hypothetical protein
VRLWGCSSALVIAPPATHGQWVEAGARLGLKIRQISHAKFRQPTFKIQRDVPIIADEFHLFGGHKGQGWKKLDRAARGLQAPLVLASATPNYNDAERCYCIQHVLDPHSVKGGYLEFLYQHCNTQQNPFGMEPLVDDQRPFRNYLDAAEYLSALPKVAYLPDDLQYTIDDMLVRSKAPTDLMTFGLNERRGRMIASQMEEKHAVVDHTLIGDDGLPDTIARLFLLNRIKGAEGQVLVFANHATVARAAERYLAQHYSVTIVDGQVSTKKKADRIAAFRDGVVKVLVGTASLATGTDGLDKVCDTLIILDDTEDDALRRQLVGRIMPRGTDVDSSKKRVYRLVIQ